MVLPVTKHILEFAYLLKKSKQLQSNIILLSKRHSISRSPKMPKVYKHKLYHTIKGQLQTRRKIEESEPQTLLNDIVYWGIWYLYVVHVHKQTWYDFPG